MVRILVAFVGIAATVAVPKSQKVYRAPDSDFVARYQEVVRDTAEWRNVWSQSGGRPSASGKVAKLPRVNFRRKMVIVSTGSSGTTDPDSVVIQLDKGKGMYLVTTFRECRSGARKTMPIDIIAVPADPGSVLFRDKVVKGPGCATAISPRTLGFSPGIHDRPAPGGPLPWETVPIDAGIPIRP